MELQKQQILHVKNFYLRKLLNLKLLEIEPVKLESAQIGVGADLIAPPVGKAGWGRYTHYLKKFVSLCANNN